MGAGVEVETYWPGLFAKALESCDLKSLITNVGSGVGAAPAAGGAAPAGDAALQLPLLRRRRKSPRRKRTMTWDSASLTRLRLPVLETIINCCNPPGRYHPSRMWAARC